MLSAIVLKFKSTYAHITLNRVTVAFFLFSFVHCFAQGIIQSFLYSLDSDYSNVVTQIVREADIPLQNITYIKGSSNHYTLRMCIDIPYGQSPNPCFIAFHSGIDDRNNSEAAAVKDSLSSHSIFQDLSKGFTLSKGPNGGVTFQSDNANPVSLNQQCARILVYPQQVLKNSVREDLTFILMQFWLFGVSIFAVSQSSIPHTLTALGTRFLITSWSVYIVTFRTNNQGIIFHQLVSAPGTPCGVELFPTYFGMRHAYDIADAVLSCSGLLFSILLSWNLLKVYNAQSFKRLGAPEHIIRIYKFFMAVQACLQLEVFVLMAATRNKHNLRSHPRLQCIDYRHHGTRSPVDHFGMVWCQKESKAMLGSFLGIAFFIVAGWAIMFYSIVYRWSFVEWPYLGCFTVASFVLMIASAILGTICWRNFGKGLAQYLHAEAALASSNFSSEVFDHSDVEKSGNYYAYDEPEYPMPTFQSPSPQHSRGDSTGSAAAGMPAPVRGPPPIYDRPYNAF
ncbi:hypothetical protein C8R43DRAFT_1131174 [Mycena crocata]|nr:hypothetical protein C8R43DRAFT_1131174 [Mycena crocata]